MKKIIMASQMWEEHFKMQSFVLSTFHWKDCSPLKMRAVCKNAVKKIQVSPKVLKHTTLDMGSSPSEVSLEKVVVQSPFSRRHQSTSIIL